MISQLRVFLGIRDTPAHQSSNYLRSSLEEKSRVLLSTPHYFFIFMLSVIFGVLVYYRATVDEILPTLVLSFLWILFWKNSDQKGKIFLVIASVFGYVHELLGVRYGYFTYLGGFIGGSPIWLIPGYGTIFWSSYNLWKKFEEKYSKNDWFGLSNYFVALSFAALLAVDYFVFDLSTNPAGILIKFSLAFMLFRTFEGLRLAYFVAFFTVLTEFTGEMLGTWAHPDFSLLSLMAGYVFLLWVCLTLNDFAKGRYLMKGKQSIAAVVLTGFYILSLLGLISV
ncbi:hypothetical protein V7O62_03565 [Methanolobus sp. ZRKC2]|uniref:hypothetical protein n=1 Tax=Methanolobus sp. ZRKC2 TaxID=3125783 RepID=UPI0032456DBF